MYIICFTEFIIFIWLQGIVNAQSVVVQRDTVTGWVSWEADAEVECISQLRLP